MPSPEELEEMQRDGFGSPGKPLSGPSEETKKRLQELARRIESKDKCEVEILGDMSSEAEEFYSLSREINNLIRQREGLCHLSGEMLATFTLPQNAESFAKLGSDWEGIVEGWRKRFGLFSGDPKRAVPSPSSNPWIIPNYTTKNPDMRALLKRWLKQIRTNSSDVNEIMKLERDTAEAVGELDGKENKS